MRGLWLFDKDRVQIGNLTDADSIITTERYREHSGWSGRFPTSAYAALTSAYYVQIADEAELYLVEKVTLSNGLARYVEAKGRSATALLSHRILAADPLYTVTAGTIISAMLTNAYERGNALPLVVTAGTTLGSPVSYNEGWKPCDEIAIAVLGMQDLGMRSRLDGTTPTLEIYAASDTGLFLGEKYKDGSTARLITDVSAWKNFAYVHGKNADGVLVQVTVDQTAGNERREMFVSASVSPEGYDAAGFQAALIAEGAASLADTRKLEYAEADSVEASLNAGDVVWYDAGAFAASFMATEVQRTYEGGRVAQTISFGEPPATIAKALRRFK